MNGKLTISHHFLRERIPNLPRRIHSSNLLETITLSLRNSPITLRRILLRIFIRTSFIARNIRSHRRLEILHDLTHRLLREGISNFSGRVDGSFESGVGGEIVICFVDPFGREGMGGSAGGYYVVGREGGDDIVRDVGRIGLDRGGGEIGEEEVFDSCFGVDQ